MINDLKVKDFSVISERNLSHYINISVQVQVPNTSGCVRYFMNVLTFKEEIPSSGGFTTLSPFEKVAETSHQIPPCPTCVRVCFALLFIWRHRSLFCSVNEANTYIKECPTVKAMNLYLMPSILSLIGNAVLGIHLIIKNPNSRVTHAFTVLILLLMGWAFSEIVMRSQSDAGIAFFWSKILYLNNFFLPSAFLALSYTYAGGKKHLYIVASYAVGLGFIPLLFTPHFVEGMVNIPPWGYDVQVGFLFTYFAVFYVAIIFLGTFILLKFYRKNSSQEQRRLQFMLAGFLVAVFLIVLSNIVSRVTDIHLPRTGSMFTLVATVAFAYGMVKYQLLVIPTREKSRVTMDARCGALCSSCNGYLDGLCPSCELGDPDLRENCLIYQCSTEKGVLCSDCPSLLKCTIFSSNMELCPFTFDRYGLKARNSYLWEDADPQFAFQVFRDYTIRGSFGLLITREYPEKLREKHQLPHMNVLWLSQVEGHETSIEPTNLPRLTHFVTQFIRDAPLSFVLLVGLEYLVVHNGFDKMLKHLHMINDQVMTHNSRFLVVVDPKTMEPKELSLLEREMRPLKKDNLFKSPV